MERRATYVQMQFAIDDPKKADEIVEYLLTERLVACGQRIGPMVSHYWWHGSIEHAEEWLVLLKTRGELAPRITGTILRLHPYETPEIITHHIVEGSPDYLEWISNSTNAEVH